jgi:hypothetical protein
MTGLDLESFLLLLRADLTTWMVLGLATLVLALLVWSCWQSRRALRNCLVLSLAAHVGLVLYGSTIPAVMWTVGPDHSDVTKRAHLRQIRVAPVTETGSSLSAPSSADSAQRGTPRERWGPTIGPLTLVDASLRVARPEVTDHQSRPILESKMILAPLAAVADVTPIGKEPARAASSLEPRAESPLNEGNKPPGQPAFTPLNLSEIDQVDSGKTSDAGRSIEKPAPESSLSLDSALASDRRLRPDRSQSQEQDLNGTRIIVAARAERTTKGRETGSEADKNTAGQKMPLRAKELAAAGDPIPLASATPNYSRDLHQDGSRLAALSDRAGGQGLTEIPKIYQPRLVPDRSARAQRTGASAASELAVERALDWLMRHQDDDGRWDGGIARYDDGTPVKGDDDFTIHCPAGEPCAGECAYWEADSALTGLALLTYLGAGYTHQDGNYSEVVGKGLDFLIAQQKPDGDLRGPSQVVGMYCHAMATLALCEAYALTSDERLRGTCERAVAFLVRARARDGMAWRYAPGAPAGDTSILGWVVMGLKSAKEVGIAIPGEPAVRRGTLLWLEKIATGDSKGLARYQPWEPVTPTMTAEAWVCRQFLGVGGPGPSSSEAAAFLLQNESDRGKTNVYYWYYATLALYQHGGEPWTKWNAKMRDKIVGLQSTSAHQTGSWKPDSSLYGSKGGRIYCTTLAALSLEVYYRYLRLYDAPKIPLEAGATPPRRPE